MKLNRNSLRKMILQEMQQYGNTNSNVFPKPSQQDFVIAASGVGNVLQGMGMTGEYYSISKYFLGLINADHQGVMRGFQPNDDNHYRIMNSIRNPGKYGGETEPRGNDIMNTLRELGLTYENPRYKRPGQSPMEQRLMQDLDAFASEVANNISSRRRN